MLEELAHKGVCCDATHGTTAYDFKLSSLLILDEFCEGIPVGHVLSNREDFSVLKIFFTQLKINSGPMSPRWFMSDLAPQFYDAFVDVYQCHPKWFACTWHVDKNWKESLNEKVTLLFSCFF